MTGKRIRSAVVLVAAVATLAACSSSGGGKPPATNTPGANSSTAGAQSGATSTGVAAIAGQRVKAFTAHSQPLAITKPVAVPKKLTFAYMQCVQSVCKEIGDGLQKAADAIGAKLLRITHQDTPATVQQAAVNALQAKPDAVFFSGDPTEWFAAQLKEMNAKKIPVISWSEPGGFTPSGISANLLNGDDYYFIGVLEADWVASKYGAGSHSLLLNVPAYPVLATAGKGYVEEMQRVCPSCIVTQQNFTVDDIVAGKVATGAVASLQRDKKIVEIVGTFGGLITQQLAQAVSNAGFAKVKAISASGTAANYQLIQQGQLQEADLALPSGFLAWSVVDTALRLLAGQPVSQSQSKPALASIPGHPDIIAGGVPQEFIIKSLIPSGTVTSVDQLWSPTENYQAAFKKLWGVG